jgi:hypothetical protein
LLMLKPIHNTLDEIKEIRLKKLCRILFLTCLISKLILIFSNLGTGICKLPTCNRFYLHAEGSCDLATMTDLTEHSLRVTLT